MIPERIKTQRELMHRACDTIRDLETVERVFKNHGEILHEKRQEFIARYAEIMAILCRSLLEDTNLTPKEVEAPLEY